MERSPSDSTSTGSTFAGLVVLVTLIEIMRLISSLPLPILSSSYFVFIYPHWASTTVPLMTCWHAGFQRGTIDPDATVNSKSKTITASINLNNSVLDCPELSMISTSQAKKSFLEFSSSSSLSNNGLDSSNCVLLVNLPDARYSRIRYSRSPFAHLYSISYRLLQQQYLSEKFASWFLPAGRVLPGKYRFFTTQRTLGHQWKSISHVKYKIKKM